ncbi:MAG: hypothetical protein ACP5OG_03915 [Candidatus Nanoarchaeia archaeon]
MRFKRGFGLFLIILGIGLILLRAYPPTGAAIGISKTLAKLWFFGGLGAVIAGIVVLIIDHSVYTKPDHLFCYVLNECLNTGIIPGGSDPREPVVPAFDPKKFTPKQIRESLDIGGERSLVEIVGESKEKFFPRKTGPNNQANGIYACEFYVPPTDLKVVGEDEDIIS